MICKFVLNKKGERIGESIALDGDRIIVKRGSDFYSLPQNLLQEKFGDLIIKGKVDWKMAKKSAERWKAKFSPLEK